MLEEAVELKFSWISTSSSFAHFKVLKRIQHLLNFFCLKDAHKSILRHSKILCALIMKTM